MTKESWFYFQRMQEVYLLWSVQTGRGPTQLSIHWVTTEDMVVKLTTVLYPASLLPRAFMAPIRKNLPGNVMVTRLAYLYSSKKQKRESPCCLNASPNLKNLTDKENLPENVMVTSFADLYSSKKQKRNESTCCINASPNLNNLTDIHNIHMNATPSRTTHWNITRYPCGPVFG
jgi:hypothetical protein